MGGEDQGILLRAKWSSKMVFEKDHRCKAWLVLIKSQVVDAQLFIGSSSGCFCCLTKFIDGALVEPPADVLWTVAGLQGFPLWDINLHKISSSLVVLEGLFFAEIISALSISAAAWPSGRLQKERASAKAAPSRPVHKELQTFHCCKAVSHGPFLCGLIIRSPGSTGTSPGSPCYTFHCTRWGGLYKNRRDWRLRLTKVNIFC